MQATVSILVKAFMLVGGLTTLFVGYSWWVQSNTPPVRDIRIQQTWELEPGERIADYLITSGLGDVSIALNGKNIYAPFDGKVEPHRPGCALFSSPEVPGYLFRLCGLKRFVSGDLKAGRSLGTANTFVFATLRKQPNNTWAIVEPSRDILERLLTPEK